MPKKTRHLLCAGLAAIATGLAPILPAGAQLANSSSYNSPYGMTQGAENQAVDPSLRDSNGNLTLVNGQFQSSSMSQQSGVQSMGVLGSGGTSLGSAAGFGPVGSASAIGNSLNVVTVGSNNTVIVNSTQTNNGNQTATVNENGH